MTNDPTTEKGRPPYADSKFKQQQLPSFYPKHSPIAVSVAMFICAIIFIPIGILVITVSDSIFEKHVRYDHVNKCTFKDNHGIKKFKIGTDNNTQGCRTIVYFTLDKMIPASVDSPLFMYYRINGYYQMHRQYHKSRDDMQLLGEKRDKETLNADCVPFRWPAEVKGTKIEDAKDVYSPCGMIAWSMFNDTLNIYKVPDDHDHTNKQLPSHSPVCLGGMFDGDGNSLAPTVKCSKRGIALNVDVQTRFKEPAVGDDIWTGIPSSNDPLSNYRSAGYYDGEPGHSLPLNTDEDFMVWSRAATFPDFLKLYRRIEHHLPAGLYALEVEEYYDTASFGAEKYMVLKGSSWLGGKHMVLGGTMLAVGCFGFIIGMSCCIIHMLNESRMKR